MQFFPIAKQKYKRRVFAASDVRDDDTFDKSDEWAGIEL